MESRELWPLISKEEDEKEGLEYLIQQKLELLIENFKESIYQDDETFFENMKRNSLGGDDLNRYKHWEWPQGVGLFGFWKMFEKSENPKYLEILIRYYKEQFEVGLPTKNVNTTAPLLALAYLYEYTKNEEYKEVCVEWANWLVDELPKTKEGGFQHLTSDTLNKEELWVDTLFMTVLFLAKMGTILDKQEWIEEAKYQFLLHTKYLTDKKTGLWYHGWIFDGGHNFSEALWGRGNSWITVAIPEFLEMIPCEPSIKRFLTETLRRQVEAMKEYQDISGMWHTLLDDPTSYVEASATCGIAYGILKAVKMGLIDKEYLECGNKAIIPILYLIDEKGYLGQVSYGTYMGRESKDYYKQVEIRTMPYGQAMAMLFLHETLH